MIRFGTGGWRALIGEDFTKENVMILAQAVSNLMKEEYADAHGFVIGYDRRFLSEKAAKWVAEVLVGNGIKVFFIERIAPTPLVMYTVKKLRTKYGAAITASHNPADYNGIKIFMEEGRDASEKVTVSIEAHIDRVNRDAINQLSFVKGLECGMIEIVEPFNDYIDTIISMIDIEAIKKRGLKIMLDPMFGVSKTCLQTILVTSRCELDIINDRHDTLFGGRLPSPNTHTLKRLSNMVEEKGYDLGIGTDGDADRLGIIDSDGEFIHPNSILVLLYYYMLKFKGWKGDVVRNIATTHLLDKIAKSFDQECHEVPVGFKHISSMMEAKAALIGGESSGGLTVRGHIKGKDGIFAASLLVEMLCATGKSLGELLQEIHRIYGYHYMVEDDFVFSEYDKERLKNVLFRDKMLPDFGIEIEKISYRDGIKVYFENGGWIIARFSGTEPLLRVFAEMDSKEKAMEVSNIMRKYLKL